MSKKSFKKDPRFYFSIIYRGLSLSAGALAALLIALQLGTSEVADNYFLACVLPFNLPLLLPNLFSILFLDQFKKEEFPVSLIILIGSVTTFLFLLFFFFPDKILTTLFHPTKLGILFFKTLSPVVIFSTFSALGSAYLISNRKVLLAERIQLSWKLLNLLFLSASLYFEWNFLYYVRFVTIIQGVRFFLYIAAVTRSKPSFFVKLDRAPLKDKSLVLIVDASSMAISQILFNHFLSGMEKGSVSLYSYVQRAVSLVPSTVGKISVLFNLRDLKCEKCARETSTFLLGVGSAAALLIFLAAAVVESVFSIHCKWLTLILALNTAISMSFSPYFSRILLHGQYYIMSMFMILRIISIVSISTLIPTIHGVALSQMTANITAIGSYFILKKKRKLI